MASWFSKKQKDNERKLWVGGLAVGAVVERSRIVIGGSGAYFSHHHIGDETRPLSGIVDGVTEKSININGVWYPCDGSERPGIF